MEIARQFTAPHQVERAEGLEFQSKTKLGTKLLLFLAVGIAWFLALDVWKTGYLPDDHEVSPIAGFWVLFLLGLAVLIAGILVWNNRYVVLFDHSRRQVFLRAEARFSSKEIPYTYESVTVRIYDKVIFHNSTYDWKVGDEALVLEAGRREIMLAAGRMEEVREIAQRLAEKTGLEYSIAPDYLDLVWERRPH